MRQFTFIFLYLCAQLFNLSASTPITSAEKYLEYLKKSRSDFPTFAAPETVVVIYSSAILKKILAEHPYQQGSSCFEELYLIADGKVGIYYVEGKGASPLIHKMEELIAFGVKKFISVGAAGALTKELSIGDLVNHTKALSEDGVGHLYLDKWSRFSSTTLGFQAAWKRFLKESHPNHTPFKNGISWSYPVLFKETAEDVERVVKLGCNTVEMELGAFFAIAEEKQVQALALYVISDSLSGDKWKPHLQDDFVKKRLESVVDLAIEFSQKE